MSQCHQRAMVDLQWSLLYLNHDNRLLQKICIRVWLSSLPPDSVSAFWLDHISYSSIVGGCPLLVKFTGRRFQVAHVPVELKPGCSEYPPPAGTAEFLLRSLGPQERPAPRNVTLSGSRVCLINASDFYFQMLLTGDVIWRRYSPRPSWRPVSGE